MKRFIGVSPVFYLSTTELPAAFPQEDRRKMTLFQTATALPVRAGNRHRMASGADGRL
ncbi:hypothetical protein [Vogesella alkaliphila]|uniref:hypothetical protein n=1 Tax=Vogesella alkaliphila TaxID=1193621 RepID=UPI0016757FDF|nr:hypothetical protein [Vogesella alkaliphila]